MKSASGASAIRQSYNDRIFSIVVWTLLIIVLACMIYPLIFVISASISDPNAVYGGRVWLWPAGLQFDGYKAVFENGSVLTGYRNSVIYMVFGTLLDLFVTYMGAYALSRKDLPGRGILTFFIVFTMWFGGGLIPTFLVVKGVGLVDSPLCLIILGAVNTYNLIICRSFIQSGTTAELQEAARIDGCSDFGLCWKIVLPLSAPILAVLTLYYGLEHWNSYFPALMYLNRKELQPLQIVLREILLMNEKMDLTSIDTESLKMIEMLKKIMKYSLIVVASLPMLIIYPFLQKFFVQGVMIGSIKG